MLLGANKERLKTIESKIQQLSTKINEIYYAEVLRDCIFGSDWLIKKDFTLTKGAANYSFIYLLFKVLDEINPKSILEFGLGQTTKVTSQYANFYAKTTLDVVEHNSQWISVFSKKINITQNIKVHNKELIKTSLNDTENDKYDNLDDIVKNKKYDLIIIDGPFGFDRVYPRTNILDLIPNNIANEFVIILDDAEREGEKNTANLIFEKLNSFGIQYKTSYREGTKRQLIITSLNYKFIHWI